jgi:hypothetical protein
MERGLRVLVRVEVRRERAITLRRGGGRLRIVDLKVWREEDFAVMASFFAVASSVSWFGTWSFSSLGTNVKHKPKHNRKRVAEMRGTAEGPSCLKMN